MKKLALSVNFILVSLIAFTSLGVQAKVDGAIKLESSNNDVLRVEPLEGGLFKVHFVGAGQASLKASADKDLSEGVQILEQSWDFEIYDDAALADHFDLQILETGPAPSTDPGSTA